MADLLTTLRAAWQQERATARARFAAERAAQPLRERVARGVALADLAVDETEAVPGGRTRLWLAGRAQRCFKAFEQHDRYLFCWA